MSKIFGCASAEAGNSFVNSTLQWMAGSLKQGPWQRADKWSHTNAGLGHISIQAVNTEAQPIFSWDDSKAMIFSGKIFGYEDQKKELEKSGCKFRYPDNDAEFILNFYEKNGTRRFHELNGIFSLAVWDKKKNELILVNDRYGLRPVYYYFDKKRKAFLFASELKAISGAPFFEKIVNWDAWNVFLRLGFLVDDDTFFKEVYFLPPASVLRFDLEKVSINNYWDCRMINGKGYFDEDTDIDNLIDLFKQSIKRRTMKGKKTAVFLSGGKDSAGIAAELKKQGVQFVTYTTRKFYKIDSDRKGAEYISGNLRLENKFYDLPDNFLEEYECQKDEILDYQCWEHAWLLPLLERVPLDTKLNFDGLGLDFMCDSRMYDEPYANYRKLLEEKRYEEFIRNWYYSSKGYHLIKWPIDNDNLEFLFLSKNIRNNFSTENFVEKIKCQLKKVENTHAPYIYFHLLTRARRCVGSSIFGLIVNRLESFCPYLDNDFFDYAMSLPLSAKSNRMLRTKILSKAYPELFSRDSCLLPVNAGNYLEAHNNYYSQKIGSLSRQAPGLLIGLRLDIFNAAYLAPRIAKDIVLAKLFKLSSSGKAKEKYYNKCHFGLIPQLYMFNCWLKREKITS